MLDDFEDAEEEAGLDDEMLEEYDPEDVAQLNQPAGTGEILGEGYVRVGNNLQRPYIQQ